MGSFAVKLLLKTIVDGPDSVHERLPLLVFLFCAAIVVRDIAEAGKDCRRGGSSRRGGTFNSGCCPNSCRLGIEVLLGGGDEVSSLLLIPGLDKSRDALDERVEGSEQGRGGAVCGGCVKGKDRERPMSVSITG